MPRAARAPRYLHGSCLEECPGIGFIDSGAELICVDIPLPLQYAGPPLPPEAPVELRLPRARGLAQECFLLSPGACPRRTHFEYIHRRSSLPGSVGLTFP